MAKRKIAIADFVADVRSGLSEIGLMEKYQLSADQLQAVLQQLVEAGKLDLSDLEMTPPKRELTVALASTCPVCGALKLIDSNICPECGDSGLGTASEGATSAPVTSVLPTEQVMNLVEEAIERVVDSWTLDSGEVPAMQERAESTEDISEKVSADKPLTENDLESEPLSPLAPPSESLPGEPPLVGVKTALPLQPASSSPDDELNVGAEGMSTFKPLYEVVTDPVKALPEEATPPYQETEGKAKKGSLRPLILAAVGILGLVAISGMYLELIPLPLELWQSPPQSRAPQTDSRAPEGKTISKAPINASRPDQDTLPLPAPSDASSPDPSAALQPALRDSVRSKEEPLPSGKPSSIVRKESSPEKAQDRVISSPVPSTEPWREPRPSPENDSKDIAPLSKITTSPTSGEASSGPPRHRLDQVYQNTGKLKQPEVSPSPSTIISPEASLAPDNQPAIPSPSPPSPFRMRSDGDTSSEHEVQRLFAAVQNGDTIQVKHLLQKGISPNARDRTGATPLMIAAAVGEEYLVEVLLRAGASTRLSDDRGFSAVHYALKAKRPGVLRLLITLDPEAGTGPLLEAAREGRAEHVKLLLTQGVDIDARDEDGNTPLMLAVSAAHVEIIRLLLENGANINTKNNNGFNALSFAYAFPSESKVPLRLRREVVQLLKEHARRQRGTVFAGP